jgi:hypothetical protein
MLQRKHQRKDKLVFIALFFEHAEDMQQPQIPAPQQQ